MWVDCYIYKFATLFSNIPQFLLFNNRYDVIFSFNAEGDLQLDFSNCHSYFERLLNCYGIVPTEIYWDELKKYHNILLPCDSFYFPYSKQNYQNYHLEHYILLKDYDANNYYVYDDNPAYNGWIPEYIIKNSYDYFAKPIYYYMPIVRELTLREAKSLFAATFRFPQKTLSDFINELLNSQLSAARILGIIEEARIPFKRYNALIICSDNLSSYNIETMDLREVANKYTDELSFIANLSSVGLRAPDKYIYRVKIHLEKLKEIESKLINEIKKVVVRICGDMN